MKKKINYIILLLLVFIPLKVEATTGKLICDKTDVKEKDIISCDFELTTEEKIKEVNAEIDYEKENFTIENITPTSTWESTSKTSLKLTSKNEDGENKTFKVANITFKVNDKPNYGTHKISLLGNTTTNTPTATFRIKSNNNKLSSLTIEGLKFDFNPNKNEYNLSINKDKIVINATLADEKSTFLTGYGPREVSLKYGENTINIMVSSELNNTNIYTLNIKRTDNRDDNNYLSSLSLTGLNLNPSFNKDTLIYQVNVDNTIEKIEINATLASNKATFTKDYAPRVITLNKEKTIALIQIKAENGDIKTYTININKTDKANSTYLKELTIKDRQINFEKEVQSYNITVDYETNDLEINAIPEDENAKVTVVGANTLKPGQNEIQIKVANEQEERIYRVIVTKLEKNEIISTNNNLKSIIIQNYPLNFNTEVTLYKLKIKNERQLNIEAIPEDESAIVRIKGNQDLKNDSEIDIEVISQNGQIKVYKIEISKTNQTLFFVVGGLFLLLIITLIAVIIIRKKQKNKKQPTLDENLNINKDNNRIVLGNNNLNNNQNIIGGEIINNNQNLNQTLNNSPTIEVPTFEEK